MFKRRNVTELVRKASYLRDECVPAENFQKCTHVFIKESSHHIVCPPGLYEYRLNGWLYKDDIPMVGTNQAGLLSGLTNRKLELLTHVPTLDEIKKDQELNNTEE